MTEIIKSKNDLCTGCNRCVRECPMETACVTYQDEAGSIKVRIDHDKCIACGRCISVCKHDARYYTDDTELFFRDIAAGKSISLIAAPAIRTNITQHKRLFTYLKKLGVNKIYDVSLGADICIWAHLKFIEETGGGPIITQPCPAIVTYCEMYHKDLLKRLSPVHSPMACTSIYMKEYQGITDSIAALSPCLAKANEFAETGLAKYNITFSRILEYLEDNNISLPKEETGFDHEESGLGSLFPMPGGLKENIEYFMGKKLHIAKAEGFDVYEKLDKYAEAPEEFLPDIYDVLSCEDGCNVGTGSSHSKCEFEIDKTMDIGRKKATEERNREHYEEVYKTYDETFDFKHFTRKYKSIPVKYIKITNADIQNAYDLLGKTDYEKQHIDCGACGSDTCYKMARKIVLNVNIPENCIFKSKEDAKTEHDRNLIALEQLADMEKKREADERMRAVLNVNPHINILFDNNYNVIDCNPAAMKFMRFDSKEEMIEGFVDLFSKSLPRYQADGGITRTISDRLADAVEKGQDTFETGVRFGNEKRTLAMELRKIPYEDSYAIMVFAHDITDLRSREIELMRAQEMNELQLTKMDLMVQAAKIGLWDMNVVKDDPVNPDNTFMWSDEFRHMLGYKDEHDFPNLLRSWSDLLHPEDKNRVINAFADHLLDTTGKTPYDVEYRLQRKTGEYAYYHAYGATIRDNKGVAVRVAGALMDITELKNMQEEIKVLARQQAEAESQAKSTFLATMSHEIRTPMNAIIGMTAIGKQSGDIDRKSDALEKIDIASKHLLGVINDILDFSKIESGKFDLSPVNFEFEAMLQKVVSIVNLRMDEKNQKFIINTSKDMPATFIGDDQRLSQVITNLLTNAAKFTPEEGLITLSSELLSEEDGLCRLQISVEDTGIGITEEQKERLFRSYEQAESGTTRNYGGTGLGLPISKRIVELMDGSIWVESRPGRGSKFIFTVLLERGLDEAKLVEDHAEKAVDTFADDFSQYTVLIAEDVEINREIVMALLESSKLNIEFAVNGKQAVEMYKSAPKKYNAIFMDIQMPEMDGHEATSKIRESGIPGAKKIPIIAMTANVFREDIEKCIEAGMNSHIGKPINMPEIYAQLREYLLGV